jgi:hypothetical protein
MGQVVYRYGMEMAAWQLIRRLLLAVYLWEQGGEMRAREESSKEHGVASYGSIRLKGGATNIEDEGA